MNYRNSILFISSIVCTASAYYTNNNRFTSMKSYLEELKEYNLDHVEEECLKNNEEACFIFEKIMNKELKEIFELARAIKKIQKEQTKEPSCIDYIPDFAPKSAELKEFLRDKHARDLEQAHNKELKKLARYKCSSPTDLEPFKACVECKKKKLQNKYRRISEKYPKEHFPQYLRNDDHARIKTLRHHKRMCLKHGSIEDCITLRKLEKITSTHDTQEDIIKSAEETKTTIFNRLYQAVMCKPK